VKGGALLPALALALAGPAGAGDVDPDVPQVTLELRFVEVQRSDAAGLGVDWSGGAPSARPAADVDIPVIGALLRGEQGAGHVLATPRAVSRAGEPARIEVGGPLPADGAGAESPGAVGIRLSIRPLVGPDGGLLMDIRIEADEVSPTFPLEIRPRRTATQTALDDGQTVVIGGLFSDRTREAARRIPGLADVPVLGHLFRKPAFHDARSDLLILITPQIWFEDGMRFRSSPPVPQPRPDPQLRAPNVPHKPPGPTGPYQTTPRYGGRP